MPTSTSERLAGARLLQLLRARAAALGFDEVRVAPAAAEARQPGRLARFLAEGRHGDMDWLARRPDWRADPVALWPAARSAVVAAMSYHGGLDALERVKARRKGAIAAYALGRDYHGVVKGRLKELAGWLARQAGGEVKVFVDTGPVMEKPLGERAGLGWQGKHTNLLSRRLGSWFFLGVILASAELPPDAPESGHCGTCRACLDVCPTRAFPAPYQLDARRCLSYLTIEHRGHIPTEFRVPLGNRIFGCDDCLAVCPWNKYARAAREAKLLPRPDLVAPELGDLVQLDEAGFRKLFARTAVKRTGRDRFVRNVLIAVGNSGDENLVAKVEARLGDASPLVRAMAVWALARLSDAGKLAALRDRHLPGEADAAVRREWAEALK
jgi:epoxyqueuosine reductase